jgi:cytosine/adenosine deaminase-related metal-dependent hydrolase
MFMFGKTANVKKLLQTGINVCIGTDSPMSGGENILYEMRYDKSVYKRLFKEELPDETIVRMATMNAAKAFHQKKRGQIENGYMADLAVFKKKFDDPYKSVVNARLGDVLLVVIEGKPVYGDAEYSGLFDSLQIKYQELIIEGVPKIAIGDLKSVLKRINRAVGFKKEFPFMPVELD